MRDFYKVLGIASTADNTRIKTAFRRRAKAFHPDLNPGNRNAEERFKELAQAYEVLRSAHARACYDALRARRRSEARRRFAQSAALMAASFVMTMGSAYAVMALNGGAIALREGWQLAIASIMRPIDKDTERPAPATIAVASATAVEKRPTETEIDKAPPPAAHDGETPIEWAKATSVRRHQPRPDAAADAQATVVAALKAQIRRGAESGRSTGETGWRWPWEWPEADGSYMGLGASNR